MDVTISAGFSGRPYDLRMRIYTIENNVGAGYSRYRGDRYGYSRVGYGSFANNQYTVNSWIAGYHAGGAYSLPFAPGDYAGKTIWLGSFDTGAVWHDGNGNLWVTGRIQMANASVFGTADTGDVGMWGDRLGQAPGAPAAPSISDVRPTAITLSWGAAPRGRADITNYHWQILNAAGTAVVMEATGGVFFVDNTIDNGTLTPGTGYQARVRALNGDGWGPFSGATPFSTLPSAPPVMSVLPSLSGTSAVITLSPPGGATGVTKYTIERERPDGVIEEADTSTSTFTWTGLAPGQVNRWRASAWFGGYESPQTVWLSVTQPQPNTNPGNYFDGSTPPRDDITFHWTGPEDNSTSEARGVGVDGWSTQVEAGGGVVRLQRVTGGRSGAFGARMIVIQDATGPGKKVGMTTVAADGAKRAEVEEGATYVGSIFGRPSRAQRIAAELAFFDAAGDEVLPRGVGQSVLATDTLGWTRLAATGKAPVGAVTAAVVMGDVAGDGFVAWKSGEWLDGDDAMVSLTSLFDWFSGNTPNVPGYEYNWLGPENASASERAEVPVVAFDPLADPDCPPQPAPPTLPTIPSDCIDEVGTWRRYPLSIPAGEVRIWSSTLTTLILKTDVNAERQVRIRYYPNPDDRSPEIVAVDTPFESEQILTYIPPNTEITLDGVTQQVMAVVAGGAGIPADHLLYGTGGTPATWPELRCGIGYVVTMDVPLDAPAGNLGARVIVTQRM